MDRLYYLDNNSLLGEVITYCKGIRLYDGDAKTAFEEESLYLTSCYMYFVSKQRVNTKLVLELKSIILIEEESGSLMRSAKIVLHLESPSNVQFSRPVSKSSASHIKLSFTEGGMTQFLKHLRQAISARIWEKSVNPQPVPTRSGPAARSGIVGIERKMQEKIKQTNENISVAFQDLKNLMDMAKDMVKLSQLMSNKIKERHGDISEDDTIKFKSYLLSLGIDDPVTRSAYSSGDEYRRQLAKQIVSTLEKTIQEMGGMMGLTDAFCRVNRARGLDLLSPEDFLQACRLGIDDPVTRSAYSSGDEYRRQLAKQIVSTLEKTIQEMGGMMGLTDAFCRVNRARGLDLLSPEDFLQACRLMEQLNLTVKLRSFESGVLVLQSISQSDSELDKETAKLLDDHEHLSAEDMAQILNVSVILAKERLLSAEKSGLACRDDTTEGLIFYPNLFLTRV
nr:EOG090X09MN [Cyclestheria hislopi]